MEVIHEGYLERLLSDASSKKQYKKFYFVFKREANSGTKTLEYFKDNNWKKNEPKGVCNVYSGYSVNVISQSKKKMIFELVTIDKTHELQAASEQIGTTWVNILNEGLYISTFNVTLVRYPPTAYALVRNLPPNAQLKVSDCSVCLLGYGCSSITWRFSAIRKYKLHNGNVVLEVGSRSMTGEGEFRFDTSDPKLVYETIDKAIKTRIKAKGLSTVEKPEDKNIRSSPTINHHENENNSASAKQKLFHKNRSQSQGPLTNPPSPIEENGYDHLNSIRNAVSSSPSSVEGDLYDTLNNPVPYHGGKRNSEPAISPESFLANNRVLTSKTFLPIASATTMNNPMLSQEDYVMMDDGDETAINDPVTHPPMTPGRPQKLPLNESKESKKVALMPPKPPPRVKLKDTKTPSVDSNTEVNTSSQFSITVEKTAGGDTYDHANNISRNAKPSQGTKVEEKADDTYDHPNNIPRNIKQARTPSDTDYNHLFEAGTHSHSKPIPQPNINENSSSKNVVNQASPTKSPTKAPILPKGVFLHNKFSKHGGSTPLKPVRPAPKPPNKQKNMRQNEIVVDQPLYDIPKSNSPNSPCEYNEVGDIIPGEYAPNRLQDDDDGYVEVPHSNSDAIYQVPRE